jgi:predicted ATPase
MRITFVRAEGALSFNSFQLDLDPRLTVVVGPNGAGKSNLGRLLGVCQRAIECADKRTSDLERMLASFLAARHVGSKARSVEVRLGFELTDSAEKAVVVEYMRALVVGALFGNRTEPDTSGIDSWAASEITEDKLRPLMRGEIVASHRGTEDAGWLCAVEFSAPDHQGQDRQYRWNLMGHPANTLTRADAGPGQLRGVTVVMRMFDGNQPPDGGPVTVPGGSFSLADRLLPHEGQQVMSCAVDMNASVPESHRRLAEMTGTSLVGSAGGRNVSFARVFRVLFQRALVQTSDTRLIPGGGYSWSGAGLAPVEGAERRLPELLLRLKNGAPAERARYRVICDLFKEFTQGRSCEVRLMQLAQPQQPTAASSDAGQDAMDVPAVWVTVDVVNEAHAIAAEVPIEFAGAGAWEALVLASALAEQAASVIMLDEPAVALHSTLLRVLSAHLQKAPAQFVVITHSPELLPLEPTASVQIVRFDRNEQAATQRWVLSEESRQRMARKLIAKGNERLPFAWRCVLCEGEDDVEAVLTLAEKLGIDLRAQNIAVADCGGRDNQPAYIRFCSALGLRYLTVMDADASKAASQPAVARNVSAVRDAVRNHPDGELAEFPEDLETTLGVAKQRPSRVPAAIKGAASSTAPSELVNLARALCRLAGSAVPALW